MIWPLTRRRARESRLRVLMVSPHFEEYALRLSVALAKDAEVMLATDLARLRGDYQDRPFPTLGALELRDVRFATPLDLFRLLSGLIRLRPHIVHLQEASGLRKAILCAVLVFMARPFCRIALTVHDPKPHGGRDTKIAQRLNRYRRYVRRAAQVIFVHGPFCFEEYLQVRETPSQVVAITEHGELLVDASPQPLGEGPFSLLCFGRMEAYKGIGVLHEALRLLAGSGCYPSVKIVGTGPELDEFIGAFAQMPNVTVENAFVPSSRLIEALRNTDAVLMPYLEATHSGVLAASLANGRFVIASKVGGIPDVVEHMVNGLLVPPSDAHALARAIRTVSEDRNLRVRLGAGALRTKAERLDWNKIARTVLTAYGE